MLSRLSIWEVGEERCPSVSQMREQKCDWEWLRVTIPAWRKVNKRGKGSFHLRKAVLLKPAGHQRLLDIRGYLSSAPKSLPERP